jgi:hypothetical protein
MVHPLFYQEDPEQNRLRQESEYEEKLVGHLLTKYGLGSYKAWLRKQATHKYGDTHLRLSDLVEYFGQFPVYMAVTKIPGLTKNCTVDKLFNKMPTRKMVEIYTAMRDELVPEEYQDMPFALAFPWPYIPKGFVLHDKAVTIDEIIPGLSKPCVRMIWTLSKRKQRYGKYLVLEPIDQFVAGIKWEPVSPFGES